MRKKEPIESLLDNVYHFLDMKTGERVQRCEVSSIDIALLLAGVLFAGE